MATGWFADLEHGVGLLSGGNIQQAQDMAQKVAEAKANPARNEKGGRPTKEEVNNLRNSKVVPGGDTNDRIARAAQRNR